MTMVSRMKNNLWFPVIFFIIGLISGAKLGGKPWRPEPVAVSGGQYSLTLSAVGDIIMHLPVVNSARQPDGSFDFRPIFASIRPFFNQADLAVAVLETQLDAPGRKYSGYPRFNSPSAIADAIQWAGVDLAFLAHNHSLDQGITGIDHTLTNLERIGLAYTGCRSHPAQPRYLIINKSHIKLAFFSYTTTTNGIPLPLGKEWAVNLLDYDQIASDIAEARRAGADGIIFALHAGTEYRREPSPEQLAIVDKLISLGVDIVLGSHVHVVQPVELRHGAGMIPGRDRIHFIAYSLGNLLSNQRWRYSDCGLMVNLKLVKNPGWPGIRIAAASYSPLWVYRRAERRQISYEIIMLDRGGAYRARFQQQPEILEKLDEVREDTDELIRNWNQKPMLTRGAIISEENSWQSKKKD